MLTSEPKGKAEGERERDHQTGKERLNEHARDIELKKRVWSLGDFAPCLVFVYVCALCFDIRQENYPAQASKSSFYAIANSS